jgi:hypothetical protein
MRAGFSWMTFRNCRRRAVSPVIFSNSIWGINRRGGSRTALLSLNNITGGQFMSCPYIFMMTSDESNDRLSFDRRCYSLAPARIGMLRFLVEGYDGILFLRTIAAATAVVELSWSRSSAAEAEGILAALCAELGMVPEVE